MNGSSQMTNAADSAWWIVRPSLAAGLVGACAVAAGAFRFAGMPGTGMAFNTLSLAELMHLLSATPTLIAIAVFACVVLLRRNSRRSLRVLCMVLALASFAGAGINAVRDSYGRGPIETWVEKTLTGGLPAIAEAALILHTSTRFSP